MSDWLVPFRGREHSTALRLNFLWATDLDQGRVYIMDNHRAAMWCWLRHLPPANTSDQPLHLLHVDRHYDALCSPRDLACLRQAGNPADLSIQQYLDVGYESDFLATIPLFRWDNYLGLFMSTHRERVGDWYMATHGQGRPPEGVEFLECLPWHFPAFTPLRQGQWLLNVDLDYFFRKGPQGYGLLFSREYVRDFFSPLAALLRQGRGQCLTISLSPECCGGWANAEELLALACAGLGLDFQLPA